MTAPWSRNLEAYRLIADVLVTFRRIVARAVVKAGVNGDPELVWPPEVLETLRRRWREEVETERHPTAEDDVLAFATFHDLSELVAGDSEAARLLARLSPASGELVDLLEELEILRRRVAIAYPMSDADLERLAHLQVEFRGMLAGGRGTDGPTAARSSAGAPRRGSKKGGAAGGQRAKPPAVAASAKASAAPGPAPHPAPESVPPAAEPPPLPPVPPPQTPSEALSAPEPLPRPAARDELSPETAAVIAAGDDRLILRELHREVMGLADGIYTGSPLLTVPVWRELSDQGWIEGRRDALALDPLLRFYGLIDVLSGIDLATDERRKALSEAGFASLLLELRQMFRRHLA